MRKTTDAMQQGLGKAVLDLRAAMRWGQTDLANEISRLAEKAGVHHLKPTQVSVSRWETGDCAPSQEYRTVLARIASRDKRTDHLAELFRAPVSAWRLVGLMAQPPPRDEK